MEDRECCRLSRNKERCLVMSRKKIVGIVSVITVCLLSVRPVFAEEAPAETETVFEFDTDDTGETAIEEIPALDETDEPALAEELPGEAAVINGAADIAEATITGIKDVYKIETVNGKTTYIDGVKKNKLALAWRISLNDVGLFKNIDYEVSFTEGLFNKGSITFTGIGDYSGSKELTFRCCHMASYYGANRYETAVAIAGAAFPDKAFDSVVIVKGADFPDALCASSYAGYLDCPLLLTKEKSLPPSVQTYLSDNKSRIAHVTVIGGGLNTPVKAVKEILPEASVEVIKGKNRYETAEKVCEKLEAQKGDEAYDTVIVTTGQKPADALSAATWSYRYQYPILLAKNGTVRKETAALIKRFEHVILLGGTNVVKDSVCRHVTPVRLGGMNRYETSRLISDYFLANSQYDDMEDAVVALALGPDKYFPDALAGSQLARLSDAPMLPINEQNCDVPDSIRSIKAESDISRTIYTFIGSAGRDKTPAYNAVADQLVS